MDKWIQPVVLLLMSTVISFSVAFYWMKRKATEDAKVKASDANQILINRIVELEKQSALLSNSVLPISTAFQAILVKELTHFHTPEMDALMVKLGPPYILNEWEEVRLMVLLKERALDHSLDIPQTERDAALMLPMLMLRVKEEKIMVERLSLVGVPRVLGDGTKLI